MKYKFIYDDAFLESRLVELSCEEIRVVLATIIGQHNAVFYGYKPERLVNVIKKLYDTKKPWVDVPCTTSVGKIYSDLLPQGDGGVMCFDNIDYNTITQQSELTPIASDTHVQFIATLRGNPWSTIPGGLHDCFDIMYECKPQGFSKVDIYSVKKGIDNAQEYRKTLLSGRYITGKLTNLDSFEYWYNGSVFEYYKNSCNANRIKALKISKVSRSLADIDLSSLVEQEHLEEAIKLYMPRGGVR